MLINDEDDLLLSFFTDSKERLSDHILHLVCPKQRQTKPNQTASISLMSFSKKNPFIVDILASVVSLSETFWTLVMQATPK